MRIIHWSSDVCSSDLYYRPAFQFQHFRQACGGHCSKHYGLACTNYDLERIKTGTDHVFTSLKTWSVPFFYTSNVPERVSLRPKALTESAIIQAPLFMPIDRKSTRLNSSH